MCLPVSFRQQIHQTKGIHKPIRTESTGANFSTSSHCQELIANLQSGIPLLVTSNGCTDTSGNEILRFSTKFKNTLDELSQKGYHPKGALINFIVYWMRQEDKKESKIVLTEIRMERDF